MMIQTPPRIEYVKGYSIALLCLGAFLLVGALQIRFLGATDSDATAPFAFISSLLVLLGLPCLVVSLLRWMRAPMALPATAALSIVLLFGFPVGTVLFFYWLNSVKPKEAVARDEAHSTWFYYTVALYIMGLMLLDTALVLRFVLGSPAPESRLLEMVALGALIVGLAAIAIGVLRSVSLRGGHLGTLIFNALLVLWFPLGTSLALIWFFLVRKHEKRVLAEGEPQHLAA